MGAAAGWLPMRGLLPALFASALLALPIATGAPPSSMPAPAPQANLLIEVFEVVGLARDVACLATGGHLNDVTSQLPAVLIDLHCYGYSAGG